MREIIDSCIRLLIRYAIERFFPEIDQMEETSSRVEEMLKKSKMWRTRRWCLFKRGFIVRGINA